MKRGPRDLLELLLDLVFPKRCVQCGVAGAWLCPRCLEGLRPVEGGCRRCGRPAARPADSCPECRGRDLGFVSARAAYVYDGAARSLVTACKFRYLRALVREMAALAEPRFRAALPAPPDVASGPPSEADDGPLVTCVPADRGRRLERGFNQAELLAQELAARAGLRFAPVLARTRPGARQSTLHGARRRENVSGAFAVRPEALPLVRRSKRVVIVDDVYTTGETLSQCAAALRDKGCEVRAFTFARTVRHTSPAVAET